MRQARTLAVLLLTASPIFAADRAVQSGIDLWSTPGNGKTFVDFSKSPIPAGFFCFNSAPFTGRIAFQGVPVVTGEPGILGKTDTIIQRLDDATFNARGVATTRIQMRVLQLESVKPIQTACGAFQVEVKLNGEQPVTSMRIVRENESGGRFFAGIAVNSTLVFKPVGRVSSEILELSRNVRFPANQAVPWSDGINLKKRSGFVLVDTDSDRVPDTYLPRTTAGFAAGVSRMQEKMPSDPCHYTNTQGHCPYPTEPLVD